LGIDLGGLMGGGGGGGSSRQGIYTSVPGPQRRVIENSCKSLMGGISQIREGSVNVRSNDKPSPSQATNQQQQEDAIPHLALRRWGSFNLFRSDPYMTVMNDCTQVLALIGSPSMNVPLPNVPPPRPASAAVE